jgi:AcrR family transcriptional regulator
VYGIMSTMATPPKTPPRPRAKRSAGALTPEAWVEAATEVLVDQGIDHVRVDVLAGELGVTRGSFYWHFRDREDLLRRVLAAWRERATEQLTARLERAHTDPREQMRDVISLPFRGRSAERAARIELAIRAWARRDETARAAVDEADASRIAYHVHLFSALGFERAEARSRAFLLYGYEVAESLLHRQGSPEQRRARAAFVEKLLRSPVAA